MQLGTCSNREALPGALRQLPPSGCLALGCAGAGPGRGAGQRHTQGVHTPGRPIPDEGGWTGRWWAPPKGGTEEPPWAGWPPDVACPLQLLCSFPLHPPPRPHVQALRVSVGQLGVMVRVQLRLVRETAVERTLRDISPRQFLDLMQAGVRGAPMAASQHPLPALQRQLWGGGGCMLGVVVGLLWGAAGAAASMFWRGSIAGAQAVKGHAVHGEPAPSSLAGACPGCGAQVSGRCGVAALPAGGAGPVGRQRQPACLGRRQRVLLDHAVVHGGAGSAAEAVCCPRGRTHSPLAGLLLLLLPFGGAGEPVGSASCHQQR